MSRSLGFGVNTFRSKLSKAMSTLNHKQVSRRAARRKRQGQGDCCCHDHRFTLLGLAQIMALETADDVTFSLKVLAAYAYSRTEDDADQLTIERELEILRMCENNIRHGHTLVIQDTTNDTA